MVQVAETPVGAGGPRVDLAGQQACAAPCVGFLVLPSDAKYTESHLSPESENGTLVSVRATGQRLAEFLEAPLENREGEC
jgi:hypothetical protein